MDSATLMTTGACWAVLADSAAAPVNTMATEARGISTVSTKILGNILSNIHEPPGTDTTFQFFNLTVQVPTSGANQDKLVLSGTATAQRNNATINRVQAGQTTCLGSVAPADCPATTLNKSFSPFTITTITAVTVQSGQQILATVVFSFS